MNSRHFLTTLAGLFLLVGCAALLAPPSTAGVDLSDTELDSYESDDDGGDDEGGDDGGDDEGAEDEEDDEGPDPPTGGKTYDGTDCGGAGVIGLYVPAIGTASASAETAAEAGMYPTSGASEDDEGPDDGAVWNNYASGPHADTDAVSNMNDPAELIANGFAFTDFHPDWDDCQAVKAMVEDLRAAADTVCTSGCTIPATTPASVVFVDDDLSVGSSVSGQGMLVVTGTLSFSAFASWDGVLVVIGKGEFLRTGGSGDGVINGATIVGNIAGDDRIYGTADDCSGAANGFDAAVYHEAPEQTGNTVYCTENIIPAYPLRSFRVLDFRQRN